MIGRSISFCSVFNNGSMILDGKINYLCLLAFPISGTYRRLSFQNHAVHEKWLGKYQTKSFKKMFLSSLKKFDIFFHPPRQSPPNWMYPLGQHRPGAVTDKCTPPKKKRTGGLVHVCMYSVCVIHIQIFTQYIHNIVMYIYHTSILLNTLNMEMYHS